MSETAQWEGFIFSSSGICNLPMAPVKGFFSIANSTAKKSKAMAAKEINNDIILDIGPNFLGKKIEKWISSVMFSGITITNNKIKDIIKVIKSIENRGISLKGTTGKITSQGDIKKINILRPLMAAGLQLMKSVQLH